MAKQFFFTDAVEIPAQAGRPPVNYAANQWYDGVPADHAAVAGAIAVPLTRSLCSRKCWITADGRKLSQWTDAEMRRDMKSGDEVRIEHVRCALVPHDCEDRS